MGNLEHGIVDQLKLVLENQQRELERVRSLRYENTRRRAELDAEEIDILLGIKQTKEHLEAWGEDTKEDV